MASELWKHRDATDRLHDDVVGFTVEALDGRVGKVDRVNYKGTCIVLQKGRWPFGGKQVIPGFAVREVDSRRKTVFIDVERDDIENAPKYDESAGVDEECEKRVESYYAALLTDRMLASGR